MERIVEDYNKVTLKNKKKGKTHGKLKREKWRMQYWSMKTKKKKIKVK